MQCHVYLDESPWDITLGVLEDVPECGEDFCDRCGDCLSCFGGGPCFREDGHLWVKYMAQHEFRKAVSDLAALGQINGVE